MTKTIELANVLQRVNIDDPSQVSDALQQLIEQEMKSSGCAYEVAWNRVGNTPEGKKLFATMIRSDVNIAARADSQKATEREQQAMMVLRSQSPLGAPGAASMPPDSKAPPQIKTLRANGTKI